MWVTSHDYLFTSRHLDDVSDMTINMASKQIVIDGFTIYPMYSKYHSGPIPYRVRKFYDDGKQFRAIFHSIQKTPAEVFANFYHLVDELHIVDGDGCIVKRLSGPMTEKSNQQHIYPSENTYLVKNTGDIFKSDTSHILQSYEDYMHLRVEEPMDWE